MGEDCYSILLASSPAPCELGSFAYWYSVGPYSRGHWRDTARRSREVGGFSDLRVPGMSAMKTQWQISPPPLMDRFQGTMPGLQAAPQLWAVAALP